MSSAKNTRASTRSEPDKLSKTDMEMYKTIMKELLQEALNPIKHEVQTLTSKFENVQDALQSVKSTAYAAESKANEALAKAGNTQQLVYELQSELKHSQHDQKLMHDKLLKLEAYSHRENLRIEGQTECKDEDCLLIIQEIITEMGVDLSSISIAKCHRLGPYQRHNRNPRPIIFKLVNLRDRDLLWSKRASLKGCGVWIAEEFPVEIDKKRKQLSPFVRAARQGDPDHPDTKISAYLKADKMIINKKSYDDLDALPPFVKTNYANPPSTKITDGVTLFFSKISPFSDFHPCTFVIEEISYTSIEQYLCHQKALKLIQQILPLLCCIRMIQRS